LKAEKMLIKTVEVDDKKDKTKAEKGGDILSMKDITIRPATP